MCGVRNISPPYIVWTFRVKGEAREVAVACHLEYTMASQNAKKQITRDPIEGATCFLQDYQVRIEINQRRD